MIDNALIISGNTTLIEALQIMDRIEKKLLIICENSTFFGVISIGDIQRAILKKKDLSDSVIHYIRNDIIYAKESDGITEIKNLMKKERIECMPIVNSNMELTNVIEWKELFSETSNLISPIDDQCPVIIMAGGRGSRLKPLTNFIPKALVPISDKTIVEEIMNRFILVGCKEFIISLNYKSEEIIQYVDQHKDKSSRIMYIKEEIPLGTCGSLGLMKKFITSTFFVSNCDIIIDVNLSDLYEYHKNNNCIATVVTAVKSYSIPYGILETGEDGLLIDIKEKPNISYQINTGLYLFEPEIFDYIEDNHAIDIPDLLMKAKSDGNRVAVFPIPEGAWKDIGNWKEYINYIQKDN